MNIKKIDEIIEKLELENRLMGCIVNGNVFDVFTSADAHDFLDIPSEMWKNDKIKSLLNLLVEKSLQKFLIKKSSAITWDFSSEKSPEEEVWEYFCNGDYDKEIKKMLRKLSKLIEEIFRGGN